MLTKKGRRAMFPWTIHLTFDTQTILTIVLVLLIIASLVWIIDQLTVEPSDPEPRKPKMSDLPPHAPPLPPHIKLGPRFAYIEAWKREQEKDKPFFPDVLVLGATPAAASAPADAETETSPDAETLEEEADWLNDRPLASRIPTSRVTTAPKAQAEAAAQKELAGEPEEALETDGIEAPEEAAPRLPTLRPVSPDSLVEFGWLKQRGDAAEKPAQEEEADAEARPSLHPVSLEWIEDAPFEEPAPEPEPLHPVAGEQPRAEQPPAMTRPKAATEEGAVAAPAALSTPDAHAAPAETIPLVIQAFGRAQLIVLGRSLGQYPTQRLELVLYLAHDALQPGGEAAFVDRLLISDALWPGIHPEGTQLLVNLRACKANLLEDVAAAGLSLEQYPWLETGPESALRLQSGVASDLSSFTALVEQIAEARAQAECGAQVVTLAQVETWQAELQALYRGEFAQQFKPKPWITKARRFYQARQAQARFDLARLLVCLGAERHAIEVGTETVLEADPSGDDMMRLLVTWVQRQEPIERQAWASRFAAEYEHRYGQTLAKAHEKMETLRLSVLPGR